MGRGWVVLSCKNCVTLSRVLMKLKMRKSTIIESISKLPDEVSIEEIIERLLIIEKIEKGQQQVKEGKINSEDQAKEKLTGWLN